MTTITLWLLVSIGFSGPNRAAPTQVVERFASQAECERVRATLASVYKGSFGYSSDLNLCIQATVVKP